MTFTDYEIVLSAMHHIKPEELFIRTRKSEIKQARQLCMYYRRLYLNYSHSEAALRYGLDHSTCCHAIKVVKDLTDSDKSFRVLLNKFLNEMEKIGSIKISEITIDDFSNNPFMESVVINHLMQMVDVESKLRQANSLIEGLDKLKTRIDKMIDEILEMQGFITKMKKNDNTGSVGVQPGGIELQAVKSN